jgi:hypothetical protein
LELSVDSKLASKVKGVVAFPRVDGGLKEACQIDSIE